MSESLAPRDSRVLFVVRGSGVRNDHDLLSVAGLELRAWRDIHIRRKTVGWRKETMLVGTFRCNAGRAPGVPAADRELCGAKAGVVVAVVISDFRSDAENFLQLIMITS